MNTSPKETAIARKAAATIAAERHWRANGAKFSEAELAESAKVLFLRERIAKLEAQIDCVAAPSNEHAPVTEKQRGAYLNIIGGLLGLLLGHSSAGVPYSKFESQQAIIDALHGVVSVKNEPTSSNTWHTGVRRRSPHAIPRGRCHEAV